MPEGYGPFTHISIKDLPPLFSAGTSFSVIQQDAACFALELAATDYSFDLQAWQHAGWMDVVYYPETWQERLLPQAEALLGKGKKFLDEMPGWDKLRIILRRPGNRHTAPDADEVPEDEIPEDERALLLAHLMPDGRYLIAVAFRGTGGRMQDWAPNIDCAPRDGYHSGFLELARKFDKNADVLMFPQTAGKLGLGRLSLRDILHEAKREDSRFVIFATGHSQGGAIVQLWIRHLLDNGVLPANIRGCGFASPSVAFGKGEANRVYPIVHIINSDDVTPRVGAYRHLGRVLSCPADTSLRSACYADNWKDAEYRAVMRGLHGVRGTGDAFQAVLAFLQAANELPEEEASAVLHGILGFLRPDLALRSTVEHAQLSIRLMIRLLGRNYRLVSKVPLDDIKLAGVQEEFAERIRRIGPERYAALFCSALAYPHMLVRDPEEGMGAYHYIVMNGMRSLKEIVEG